MGHNNRDLFDIDLVIPKPDPTALVDGLRDGRYDFSTVIGRINNFLRDTLGTLEHHAGEEVKINLENKIKIERMDRTIAELTEQIQSMRQTIVYKDEILEEKKREIERYKAICEMSSNVAMRPIDRPNNNIGSHNQSNDAPQESTSNNNQDTSDLRDLEEDPTDNNMRLAKRMTSDDRSLDELINTYYSVRSPSHKLGLPVAEGPRLGIHHRHKQQMKLMGGMNIKGPRPVPLNRVVGQSNSGPPQLVRRVNIEPINQNDPTTSSAGEIAEQIRQKIHEKITQRQPPSASFDRLSSRRKRYWPF